MRKNKVPKLPEHHARRSVPTPHTSTMSVAEKGSLGSGKAKLIEGGGWLWLLLWL